MSYIVNIKFLCLSLGLSMWTTSLYAGQLSPPTEPVIGRAPIATNLYLSGVQDTAWFRVVPIGGHASIAYTYTDADDDFEGSSQFTLCIGGPSGCSSVNSLAILNNMLGKTINGNVTPVSQTGMPFTGSTVSFNESAMVGYFRQGHGSITVSGLAGTTSRLTAGVANSGCGTSNGLHESFVKDPAGRTHKLSSDTGTGPSFGGVKTINIPSTTKSGAWEFWATGTCTGSMRYAIFGLD